MQTYLEQWLRNVLRWDPKPRGGVFVNGGRPAMFRMLEDILKIKVNISVS